MLNAEAEDEFEHVKCTIQHINLLLLFITLNVCFPIWLGYKDKEKSLYFSGIAYSIICKFENGLILQIFWSSL